MSASALVGFALIAHAATVAPPQHALVRIDGMTCGGCQQKVHELLEALPEVERTTASFAVGAACLDLREPVASTAVVAALADLPYTVQSVEPVDACPPELQPGSRRDPWHDPEGVDAVVISRGESVDLQEHLVAGKYTVIDFGAPWCGPCHTVVSTLKDYLRAHADVAVRAVTLDAPDAKASFAMPAAKQHLKWAVGLPWFEVYGPEGKRIYRGNEVSEATQAIDAARP